MPRGPKAGSGKAGPYIAQGAALRERRETMNGLELHERTQTGFAKRMGVSQSFLGQLERGQVNLPNYDLGWFERNAAFYGWSTDEMLVALGIQLIRGVRLAPSATQAREERIVRLSKLPYFEAEASHPDALGAASGEAWLEDDGFLAKYPKGYYVRIVDDHLEPHFPKGWFAAVLPDAALAMPKMAVLVWINGQRLVRYLLRQDGDELVLYQPRSATRVIVTSEAKLLGAVIDVKREIRPERVPRLSTKEIVAVLAEERPDLLEQLEL
jgi:transcriptional regulator with XRE-family HTH domain